MASLALPEVRPPSSGRDRSYHGRPAPGSSRQSRAAIVLAGSGTSVGGTLPRARLGEMEIDHVVLWVDDPKRALDFYVEVMGLEAVRARDFEAGRAPFPSVRVNDGTIIDLMSRTLLPLVRKSTAGGESGGEPINHVCLSMTASAYDALVTRLDEHGIRLTPGPRSSFGARGVTAHSAYFRDPDGNVLEIRRYGTEC